MTRMLFRPGDLQHKHNRCYLCHQVGLHDASYSDICLRHQLLISWWMFWLLLGRRAFHGLWRLVRWW